MKASGSGRMPGEFLQGRQHVERGGIAVRILAGRKRLCLLAPVAAGQIGNELEQHVGRRRQRNAVGQHLAQRASADREVRRRVKRSDHRIDQRPDRWPGKCRSESPTS